SRAHVLLRERLRRQPDRDDGPGIYAPRPQLARSVRRLAVQKRDVQAVLPMTDRVRIGVDLGGTKIEGILLDGSDEILWLRVDTPRDDYAATVEAIAALVEVLEERAGLRGSVG